jgi:hypothetical protein
MFATAGDGVKTNGRPWVDEGQQKRRRAIRFPVRVPVEFRWSDVNGVVRRGAGRSYDVSDLGAFVIASASPPVGAEVNYRLYLSGYPGSRWANVQDEVGQVVRVEQARGGEGRSGFTVFGQSRKPGRTHDSG